MHEKCSTGQERVVVRVGLGEGKENHRTSESSLSQGFALLSARVPISRGVNISHGHFIFHGRFMCRALACDCPFKRYTIRIADKEEYL